MLYTVLLRLTPSKIELFKAGGRGAGKGGALLQLFVPPVFFGVGGTMLF